MDTSFNSSYLVVQQREPETLEVAKQQTKDEANKIRPRIRKHSEIEKDFGDNQAHVPELIHLTKRLRLDDDGSLTPYQVDLNPSSCVNGNNSVTIEILSPQASPEASSTPQLQDHLVHNDVFYAHSVRSVDFPTEGLRTTFYDHIGAVTISPMDAKVIPPNLDELAKLQEFYASFIYNPKPM